MNTLATGARSNSSSSRLVTSFVVNNNNNKNKNNSIPTRPTTQTTHPYSLSVSVFLVDFVSAELVSVAVDFYRRQNSTIKRLAERQVDDDDATKMSLVNRKRRKTL